ncbi:MAG TPA: hypothetical protein DCM02_14710 [Flavobacterium sp.]|nr:hypothetical protein [Flavobacterium sp.]HAT77421.1 hypothetical protein [Flavobacterium sp.]HAT81376.1 hypothetical protein [Flavobacterium sp.]
MESRIIFARYATFFETDERICPSNYGYRYSCRSKN